MEELAALYPAVRSVSIVPVGLTKFREGLYPLTAFTPALAAETIDRVTGLRGHLPRKARRAHLLLRG